MSALPASTLPPWRVFPRFSESALRAEKNPRHALGVHLPLVAAFAALCWLPGVEAATGMAPLPATGLMVLHVLMPLSLALLPVERRWPRATAAVPMVVNFFVTSGLVYLTGRPTTPLWALYLVYPAVTGIAFGRAVLPLVLTLACPVVVGVAWAAGGVDLGPGGLAFVALFAVVATMVNALLGNFSAQAQALHHENAVLRAAAAVESERQRIASDLHGGLGASLTEVALWLGVATAHDGPRAREATARAHQRSLALLDELRASVGHLCRDDVGAEELEPLLRTRLEGLCLAGEARLALEVTPGRARLPSEQAWALFRFVEESALNAVKHGAPGSLRVRVSLGEPLWVTVEDDGRGFEPAAVARGHGLNALERFARALGGQLALEGRPGGGTTVALRPKG